MEDAGTVAGSPADGRDRDVAGRARNARPRDGLGRPLPYGAEGVERQPEGVVRTPRETVAQAQALLDAGKPFHAHEVFEDAWKSGPEDERALWRGLAQLAVGLTHAARGNATGGARLLRRGAGAVEEWAAGRVAGPVAGEGSEHGAEQGFDQGIDQGVDRPYGVDLGGLVVWARELADRVERGAGPVDAGAEAPRLGS
ncbi:DUF309 domain-containing protein [Streptomyces sp. NPDC048297]|uniref:DUF309 domain-containing protein n=1 Tax=Streptomyces sp. NPDC048297 TaxID=3365531 RepID=UPI0037206C6B